MSTVTIVQGEDRTLNFQIKEIDSDSVTTYLDLTDATAIEMRVSDVVGTGFISFTLADLEITVTDAKNGAFKVKMSDTKTNLMRLQSGQSVEVIVDMGAPSAGDRRIAQLFKAITVVKRLFP